MSGKYPYTQSLLEKWRQKFYVRENKITSPNLCQNSKIKIRDNKYLGWVWGTSLNSKFEFKLNWWRLELEFHSNFNLNHCTVNQNGITIDQVQGKLYLVVLAHYALPPDLSLPLRLFGDSLLLGWLSFLLPMCSFGLCSSASAEPLCFGYWNLIYSNPCGLQIAGIICSIRHM